MCLRTHLTSVSDLGGSNSSKRSQSLYPKIQYAFTRLLIIQMPLQMSVASVTISDIPRFTPANCFLLLASVRSNCQSRTLSGPPSACHQGYCMHTRELTPCRDRQPLNDRQEKDICITQKLRHWGSNSACVSCWWVQKLRYTVHKMGLILRSPL